MKFFTHKILQRPEDVVEGETRINSSSYKYFVNLFNTLSINGIQVTELNNREILYTEANPLTKATVNRPVYTRSEVVDAGDFGHYDVITLYPTPTVESIYTLNYFRTTTSPNWSYVVIKGKALYNNNSNYRVDFELHPSEEENVVSRILKLAGVITMKPGMVEVAAQEAHKLRELQNN